ncbi:MAG: vitamin K epoxide reductase family protein [Patescibacteria group bacterium]
MNLKKLFPYILIVGSIIGLLASFILTVDTIELIKNPNVELPCNINPFISCTSVASTWQASIFGFPNSLLGIVAFSMLFVIGIMLLFGGSNSSLLDKVTGENRARKPLWLLVNLGTLATMTFVMWFFFESVYRIGSLCIYCMTVWVVTWPLFLYTTIWNFREDHFKFSCSSLRFISKYHLQVLVTLYLVGILLILFQFKDFFFS